MLRKKVKQLFCEHQYKEERERVPFYAKNVDLIYLKCVKCGKEKIREFKMEEIAKEMKTCINPEIVKAGLIAMKSCLDAIDLLSSEEVK